GRAAGRTPPPSARSARCAVPKSFSLFVSPLAGLPRAVAPYRSSRAEPGERDRHRALDIEDAALQRAVLGERHRGVPGIDVRERELQLTPVDLQVSKSLVDLSQSRADQLAGD